MPKTIKKQRLLKFRFIRLQAIHIFKNILISFKYVEKGSN